ncbi:MAG: aromatic ring-hydroxylating dioxygenase subunit alpha [Pseudomonadota bacterium]|nr:aromatic ring-hydroxylating dioxygenase subunit alpha [Pseudomonadota bacterium]
MFINFWYPVLQSKDLGVEPLKRRMLGQDFVIFRDEGGQANVLSNTCVHRGGSLADGKIKGDCIQCPYHGWEFNGKGECTRIPSLGPNSRIPVRTNVDAYPVKEKYGLVFAFLGDLPESERPPMMEIPEFESEQWRATYIEYFVPINYERSIENGLDPAHNEFVHPSHGFSGENPEYKVNDLRWIGDGKWGPAFFHRFKSPAARDDKKWATVKAANDSREAGSGTFGPNHMWTYINFTEEKGLHQYMYECPVDDTHTNIFLVNLRNVFLEPDEDKRMNDRNWQVVSQDIKVLTDLRPRITPESNSKEFMLPHDLPILRYREKLSEFENLGWRIDSDAIANQEDNAAFAIPSPQRRERKGWVLDTVPLIDPKESSDRSEGVRKEAAG